jgi:Glycosyltransferase Family 4/Glycosyl transferases group 1
MKILVISWYFPPGNDIGAIRVARTAEYLRDLGHDIWVLTAERSHADTSLETTLASEQIIRTRWFDVAHLDPSRTWPSRKGTNKTSTAPDSGEPTHQSPTRSFVRWMRKQCSEPYAIPDRQIGWLLPLLRAGHTLLSQHKFDLLYASGPPFTAFLAAHSLSTARDLPWVAEYRDSWSRDVYASKPAWRQSIDAFLENRTSQKAAAIVTVSEPWAEYFRARFRKPTVAIYNGIDIQDTGVGQDRKRAPDAPLSIVYVGAMYDGLRDPSVLYEAIKHAKLGARDVQISYYGPSSKDIQPLAAKFDVSDIVSLNRRVSHRASLDIQREGDVLLLLQSPLDTRNVPGKVFEYFAARRPILGLGLDNGVPAEFIRQRNAGIYVSDPEVIAEQLKRWIAEKRASGMISDLPESASNGLWRHEQLQRLDDFLRSIISREPVPSG